MLIGHYVKRELETLFVHRFSNATMPFYRVFINSSHYWVLCGLFISYFLFHPKYSAPVYPAYVSHVCIVLFCLAEVMNLCCHLVLRSLRPAGTKSRAIPAVICATKAGVGIRLRPGVLRELLLGDRIMADVCGVHKLCDVYARMGKCG